MYELEGTIENCKQEGDYVLDYLESSSRSEKNWLIKRRLQIIVAAVSLANALPTEIGNARRKDYTSSYLV